MKNKKLLSTMLAATLAATTMSMPVMATDDGGKLDVDVTSKKTVMRVQVPTSMAVEINQYEVGESGSQITCAKAFDMQNLSQMAVKVDVTSTVDLKQGVVLANTKEGAKKSKSGDVAWLAAVAQTSGDVYDDETTTEVEDSFGKLKETNANVETFVQSGDVLGKAEQTFYLEAASGDVTYKWVNSGDAKDVKFARFFELAGEMDSSGDVISQVKTEDVYVVKSGDVSKAELKKLDKGSTDAQVQSKFESGDLAYVASGDATEPTGNTTKYMYGELASTDGKAAFRYIGSLSGVDGEKWSSEKIKMVHIAYNITGLTSEQYTDVKDECTYGLYKAANANKMITFDTTGLIKMATGTSNFKSLVLSDGSGSWEMNSTKGSWNDTWNETSTELEFQLGDAWMTFAKGKTITATLTLKDDKTYTATVAFPA